MSKHSASGSPAACGGPGGARGAARRAREHGQRRVRAGVGGARQPAGGLHHGGLGQPGLPGALDQPAQVGAQQGGEGGVDLRGGGALELAEGADRLVRERDVHVRQPLGERVAERPLVLGVPVGVQQADRDGLGLGLGDGVDGGAQRVVAELLQRAVGAHPLRGADAALARHERRRVRLAQAVEVGARLAAELDDVLEARGGDEHRARALALQQRVGGDRRPVGERARPRRPTAPARSSAASTAASTPSDWSSGVVGALAVTSRSPTATTASVKVPPTSTPSSTGPDATTARRRATRRYAASATSSVSARCWWEGQ